MKRILLTGMSGNGKTTVIEALAARGYRAVDLDQPGWSVHTYDGDWIWDEDPVRLLLEGHDHGLLFISGCAENQGEFYDLLDEVILLSAPAEIITERILTRTNSRYGKDPKERADVLHYLETIEPLIRRGATQEIDTRAPLDDVVEQVLKIAGLMEGSVT